MSTLKQLQSELRPWVRHNFGKRPSWHLLLGVIEEVGELAHAHLKQAQGIRGTKDEHVAAGKDAVGDIIIFLADYCNQRGWDLQELLDNTWAAVRKRDWKVNPKQGSPVQPAAPLLTLTQLLHGVPTRGRKSGSVAGAKKSSVSTATTSTPKTSTQKRPAPRRK